MRFSKVGRERKALQVVEEERAQQERCRERWEANKEAELPT